MHFNRQFSDDKSQRFITHVSGRRHVKFVDDPPLTISEMMRRAVNGIPLSVYQPKNDNIPLNNRFYNDDFDVLDVAIRNDMRLSEDAKKRQLEENERIRKERDEFEKWKLEQTKKDLEASKASV